LYKDIKILHNYSLCPDKEKTVFFGFSWALQPLRDSDIAGQWHTDHWSSKSLSHSKVLNKESNRMEKTILVIGATGLLGEPIAIRLKQNRYIVRLMVRDIAMAAKRFEDDFEILKGDVNDVRSLEKALDSCFGVHINLSGEIEQLGVENISSVAHKLQLQRITFISGTSVAEENT
jgi:hypothetical protein